MKKNIVIGGIGGQGIVFLSDVIAETAFKAGFNVKKTDITGLAQRGSPVTSHVKYSSTENLSSPLIRAKTADLIISLDPEEAERLLSYADHKTILIVNVTDKSQDKKKFNKIKENQIIISSGDLPPNTFILGVIFPFLNLPKDEILKTIREKRKTVELNIKAFKRGLNESNNSC